MRCLICLQKDSDIVLDRSPDTSSTTHSYPHYLILDTNVILNQIDVLEEDAFSNVVILYTVLNEVKHRSTSIYKRLLDIIGNPQRKFYIFVNEHHK